MKNEPVQVWVVCVNDFPHSVITTCQEDADGIRDRLQKQYDAEWSRRTALESKRHVHVETAPLNPGIRQRGITRPKSPKKFSRRQKIK